ncbi:MAG: translocation/assembly module TamB domain-containing protein [Cyanobacteria bacterium J06554_6]
MTDSPADRPPPSPRHRRFWRKFGLAFGVGTLLLGGAGALWARYYINNELAPFLSKTLTRSLDRPVAIGEVERVTPNSIRVGPSSVGATPTDPTAVTAETVEVRFNLLTALLTRRLSLDLVVSEAEGYLEQDEEKGWLTLETPEREPPERELFKVEVDEVVVRDSLLTLVPYPATPDQRTPILLEDFRGELDIDPVDLGDESAQRFNFEMVGSPTAGGTILFRGEVQPVAATSANRRVDRITNLEVQADRAGLPDVSAFTLSTLGFQNFPVEAEAGQVSGNLDLQFRPDEPTEFSGTTQVTDGVVQVANLPEPLTDVDAEVQFRDNQIIFDQASASLNDQVATGEGTIYLGERYDLTAQAEAVTIDAIVDTFGLDLPVPLAGTFDTELAVVGPLRAPEVLGELTATELVTVDRLTFETVRASYQFDTATRALALTEMLAIPTEGGLLTGQGAVDFSGEAVTLAFEVDGENLPGDAISTLYTENLPITLGTLDAQATVVGSPGNLITTARWQAPEAQYPGQGLVSFADGVLTFSDTTVAIAGGTVSGSGRVANGQWQADLAAAGVPLNQFQDRLSGQLTGDFQLAGPVQNAGLDTVRGQGNFQVQQLASGSLSGTASLSDGRWQTDVNAAGVALDQFASNLSGQLSGDFQLAGSAQNPGLDTTNGSGNFRVAQIAGGNLTGTGFLGNGQWQADVNAAGVQISQFSPQLRGGLSGQVQLSGQTDNFSPRAIQAQGNVALTQGLSGLSAQLEGFDQPLTSAFAWNGEQLRIDSASSSQLQANGVVIPQFSGNRLTGIQRFDLALAADRYPLAALPVALPAALSVDGLATFDGQLTGSPSAPNLVGTLQLDQFAVNQLRFEPTLAGTVNYDAGELALNVAGSSDAIAFNYSSLQDFNFRVDWQNASAQGEAEGDLLTANLQEFPLAVVDGLPRSPLGPIRGTVSVPDLQVNLATRSGMGSLTIDELELGYVAIDQFAGQVRYADDLITLAGGQVLFGNSFYELNAQVNLGPELSYNASLQTEQGNVEDLLVALSIFDLSDFGRGLQPPEWVENPLPPAAIPVELATEPAGDSNAPLEAQLRRLAEIQALTERQEEEEAQAILPPLEALSGPFAGTLTVSGGGGEGFEMGFDVTGNDWRWGRDLFADEVIAEGRYRNGILTLEPLRLTSAMPVSEAGTDSNPTTGPESAQLAAINVAGQYNVSGQTDTRSNLQLVAQNLPVDAVRDLFNLPLSLDGRLNGSATFGGELADPQMRGQVVLVDGAINNEPIESADAQFLYRNARLTLLSTLTQPDNPEPLSLTAQIPYAFDFMTVEPMSDAIAIDVDVEDEGLALINIVNRQVSWESGQGTIALQVRGTLSNPDIQGFVDLTDATFRAQALSEPVTITRGSAFFRGDRLVVQSLQGQFSDGDIRAAGTIPLGFPIISARELAALGDTPLSETPTPEETDPTDLGFDANGPLTLELNNIALDLRLYEGDVDGRVVVGGSLNPLFGGPQIGGRLRLSQGRIVLPENSSDGSNPELSEADQIEQITDTDGGFLQPRLQNLTVALDRSIQITQGNLLNFFAEGDLKLTGPIANANSIRPEGVINVRSGRINLFTTSFRLAGNDNTVTFLPERGLQDPILNVNLRTSVAEARGSLTPTTATAFASSEVADTGTDPFSSLGSLQTVRIRASIDGPASQIFQNLTLSSSPPRTQSEIIGLIGGSFISALESGGSGDLGGVVNFFGGALLNRFQDFVSSTLNLSEFRLFPVTSASRFSTDENSGNTLDIGAEVGFDVTDDFTLSLLKILTDNTRVEYNLRYQLTDEFRIRAITDLEDDNRFFLEFETRF